MINLHREISTSILIYGHLHSHRTLHLNRIDLRFMINHQFTDDQFHDDDRDKEVVFVFVIHYTQPGHNKSLDKALNTLLFHFRFKIIKKVRADRNFVKKNRVESVD